MSPPDERRNPPDGPVIVWQQLTFDGVLTLAGDIRTVKELLGHKNVKTSMINAHVLNRGPNAVRSPLDE